jgi:hypothetical protein
MLSPSGTAGGYAAAANPVSKLALISERSVTKLQAGCTVLMVLL